MKFPELTPGVLRNAVELYLEEAYPNGAPSRVKIPNELYSETSTEKILSKFDYDAKRDGDVINHRWALRLGNERYPFMKFVVQEYMLEGELVLAVDTHDNLEIRPHFPDYEAWQQVKQFNSGLQERIEARWRNAQLDTCARLAEKVRGFRCSAGARGSGRRVLVVDDEKDLAECFAGLLRGEGYEVRVAHDGPQGFGAAREWSPDLILLDYELPELDGLQVIAKLREEPRTREIPVLLASASNLTLEEMGRANGFLGKPCSAEVLLNLCAHQIDAARQKQAAKQRTT